MGQQEITADIVSRLQTMHSGTDKFDGETHIARDLGLDSMAVMDLVMELEDQYDVSIPLDKIAETETVKQLAVLILGLQEQMEA